MDVTHARADWLAHLPCASCTGHGIASLCPEGQRRYVAYLRSTGPGAEHTPSVLWYRRNVEGEAVPCLIHGEPCGGGENCTRGGHGA